MLLIRNMIIIAFLIVMFYIYIYRERYAYINIFVLYTLDILNIAYCLLPVADCLLLQGYCALYQLRLKGNGTHSTAQHSTVQHSTGQLT